MIRSPGEFNSEMPGDEGQTLHGDHAYVFFQVPNNPRSLPIVMWHGFGQHAKTWESTPDGREGFQTIFLRKRFPVYLLDQPRRGRAGRSTVAQSLPAKPDDQHWFNQFRLGLWPNYFEGVQFSRDPDALDQFLRQMTPDTGAISPDVNSNAVRALFEKIGPGILVTHSHSGGQGWQSVIKSRNIRAVVSFEPGSGFVFPEGEVPPPIKNASGALEAQGASKSEFMELTKIPILIVYGDFIPENPVSNPWQDSWRVRLKMARLWRDAVNLHGGDVTVIHLPELGIHGNTHFPFSDLNNLQIADLVSEFLKSKKLD